MSEYEYNLLKKQVEQIIEENRILIHIIRKHLPQYNEWLDKNFGDYTLSEN